MKKLQHSSRELKFKKIYNDHFQDLFVFARSITRSNDLAKDAVAEVFVNFWKSNRDLDTIKNIKSYLLVSVKNECIKIHCKNENESFFDENGYFAQVDKISPEEVLLEKELLDLINEVVNSLPEQCQLIFRMAKDKQMSYKDIAHELGVSQSTVGTQMGRAIQAIRERYEASVAHDDRKISNLAVLGYFSLVLAGLS